MLVFLFTNYNISTIDFDQAPRGLSPAASKPMSRTEQLLSQLNDSQRQAVQHVEGPLLMLAGPGSGKTRVITHRVAYLVDQGIPSRSIVALTFTNKAAEEMRNRIAKLVVDCRAWTGTFHRFCSRLVRNYATFVGLQENFSIYDTGDSKKLIKQAIENAEVNLQHHSPDTIRDRISNLKNNAVTVERMAEPRAGDYLGNIVSRVYVEYQKLLQMSNAVDFDDLLLHAVDLLSQNPDLRESLDLQYQYMMVDEYQDTNVAQYQLIRLLNSNIRNLGVTGDPDQSIYGWRGANINNILEFEQHYPELTIIRLEQNYRSTKSILGVADQLISNNHKRKSKSLHTDNDIGADVRLVAYPNVQEEASDIVDSMALSIRQGNRQPRDFAIFYRTNWLSRSFEHALRSAGIPYQIVKALEFYQRREVKDVLAYLHLINNPSDNVAFERIINVPPRKIGKVTLKRIRNYAMSNSMSMMEAARRCGLNQEISKSVATKVASFVALYDELCEVATEDVERVMRTVINKTGYRDWLTDDGSEEGHERAANIDELVVAAQEFDNEHPEDGGLERYLEQAALVSDSDAWDSEANYVSLMTLHAAKGLEFPSVFIVGLEDGLLPHERSAKDPDQLEEERRLLFVGITRAMQELQLSRCLTRFRRGSFWPCIASSFLMELPRDGMAVFEPSSNQAFDEELDEIPFDVDPWMHDGVDSGYAPNEIDARGHEEGEEPNTISESLTGYETNGFPRIMTGADFERKQQEQVAIRPHPLMYAVGMSVEHDEYGVGTIEKLSGKNSKRTATVNFQEKGLKKFRLAFCNLKIME